MRITECQVKGISAFLSDGRIAVELIAEYRFLDRDDLITFLASAASEKKQRGEYQMLHLCLPNDSDHPRPAGVGAVSLEMRGHAERTKPEKAEMVNCAAIGPKGRAMASK